MVGFGQTQVFGSKGTQASGGEPGIQGPQLLWDGFVGGSVKAHSGVQGVPCVWGGRPRHPGVRDPNIQGRDPGIRVWGPGVPATRVARQGQGSGAAWAPPPRSHARTERWCGRSRTFRTPPRSGSPSASIPASSGGAGRGQGGASPKTPPCSPLQISGEHPRPLSRALGAPPSPPWDLGDAHPDPYTSPELWGVPLLGSLGGVPTL